MKKLVMLSVYCSCLFMVAQAQTKFLDSQDAYLGQRPPGNSPKLFAPALLATRPYFSANRVAFSADGREFYYCHNFSWANNDSMSIRYFKYIENSWKGPFVLNEHYVAPTFSTNDSILYFGKAGGELWQSHRLNNGWSEPTRVMESETLYDFVPTNSGTMYTGSGQFVGAKQKPGNFDVCTISISQADTEFRTLGVPVNSLGWNGDFYIARDESFVIISANETPQFESELYISYRKPDKTWTNPKSLGPLINHGVAHRYGQYVTGDNKYLFYCYGHSEKDCAIYWVRFDNLLDSLKHTNFDPYVYEPLKDQQVTINKKFEIEIPDSSFVDDDGAKTLTYSAKLSDGKPLPSWVHFDRVKKILSGAAVKEGTHGITVTATDNHKAIATATFNLVSNG